MDKTIAYYMTLPYTLKVVRLDDGSYAGKIEEFPGLNIGGETWAEFGENVETVKRAWIEMLLEHGASIPEPAPIHA